ncbi:sigma-70 family RNA polymerase sigma factor [Weissella diestrammenae]|uniref:Sigma-70 family RNA polymerase sigma factor n=1 Tax=Weissella diestrammenae TaxID=1162633 RepID=A0A7G9T6Z3_9LACO|nr:sigma-70 family RNA polymerase sigma factor [Weissella diestrammenae]MCM0582535.1 sigma-70 family RNA polymerase sigma factor [Weissella diestrammenae]QNN75868.1 sigma-70 family RNA polymerase sigma factor [Weissella diestrammenae]
MRQKGITAEQLARAKANDETVFMALYTLYRPLIWGAYRRHPRDLTPDDWRQEMGIVFIKAIQNVALADVGAFTNYLKTAAWRTMNRIRQRRYQQDISLNVFGEDTWDGLMAPELIQSRQTIERLMACQTMCQQLNPKQKQIFRLALLGYSGKEIAQQLMMTPSNVRTSLMRIRAQLQ